MAAKSCPECGGTMSHLSFACPHCWHPNAYLEDFSELAFMSGQLDYLQQNSDAFDKWIKGESPQTVLLYRKFFDEYYEKGWRHEAEKDAAGCYG